MTGMFTVTTLSIFSFDARQDGLYPEDTGSNIIHIPLHELCVSTYDKKFEFHGQTNFPQYGIIARYTNIRGKPLVFVEDEKCPMNAYAANQYDEETIGKVYMDSYGERGLEVITFFITLNKFTRILLYTNVQASSTKK